MLETVKLSGRKAEIQREGRLKKVETKKQRKSEIKKKKKPGKKRNYV